MEALITAFEKVHTPSAVLLGPRPSDRDVFGTFQPIYDMSRADIESLSVLKNRPHIDQRQKDLIQEVIDFLKKYLCKK